MPERFRFYFSRESIRIPLGQIAFQNTLPNEVVIALHLSLSPEVFENINLYSRIRCERQEGFAIKTTVDY